MGAIGVKNGEGGKEPHGLLRVAHPQQVLFASEQDGVVWFRFWLVTSITDQEGVEFRDKEDARGFANRLPCQAVQSLDWRL